MGLLLCVLKRSFFICSSDESKSSVFCRTRRMRNFAPMQSQFTMWLRLFLVLLLPLLLFLLLLLLVLPGNSPNSLAKLATD